MHVRHPHEDAFILFRYVEHLAHGQGIVFNTVGPHAEGATDFLWMVLLALGTRLGVDVAEFAALLNALGVALLAGLGSAMFLGLRAPSLGDRAFLLILSMALPFLPFASASYEGFSSLLYCGLIVGGAAAAVSEERKWVHATPWLALIVALFRPDGVLLAVPMTVTALWRSRARLHASKRLLFHVLAAAVLGACYFMWRYRYFGLLLPLPLYVKSRGTAVLPGLEDNWDWFWNASGAPLILLCCITLALVVQRRGSGAHRSRSLLWIALPAVFLFAGLLFAHQSQNIAFRFQAPIHALLLALMLSQLGVALDHWPSHLARGSGRFFGVLAIVAAFFFPKTIWPLDYMDGVSVELARHLNGKVVAATEAGRLAFWTDGTVIDVVGLNDPRCAQRPADLNYISAVQPDVIMFHAAGTLSERLLRRALGSASRGEVGKIPAQALGAALQPSFSRLVESAPREYPGSVLPHRLAAATLAYWLSRSSEYEVVLLRYGGSFRHVWAVRKSLPDANILLARLEAAPRAPYWPYSNFRRLRLGRLACTAMEWPVRILGAAAFGWPRAPSCP
ncbi:MAG TPA: hypothetical protein VFQ61_25315 [Polyangiaceae bacterium]|nr:hypothetical protein [Polyangiaceae bacterium]